MRGIHPDPRPNAPEARENWRVTSERLGEVYHRFEMIPGVGALLGESTTTSGPEGANYSPDRMPSTGLDAAVSDEFDGGLGISWRWGNQGTATETNEYDTSLITAPNGAVNPRVRWVTAPNAVDFSVYMRFSGYYANNFANGGIMVLCAGDETTPTEVYLYRALHDSGFATRAAFYSSSRTSYTAGEVLALNAIASAGLLTGQTIYLWLNYTASTKALVPKFSHDGMTWVPLTGHTATAHPVSIGRFADPQGATIDVLMRAHWWRVFTSAAGASAAQLTGGRCGA